MPLLSLPPELLLSIFDYITDPLDLFALRLTHRHFDHFVAPRFAKCFSGEFQLTEDYDYLNTFFCDGCTDDNFNDAIPPALEPAHMPMISYDALIWHAASRNNIRHARSIFARRYPRPALIGGRLHAIDYVGWQEGLSACARHGWKPMLKLLLANKPHPPPSAWDSCPLHWAVLKNRRAEAAMLIRAGVPLDFGFVEGDTNVSALYIAVRGHQLDMVDMLLKAGARVEIDAFDDEHQTHAILAAATGSGGKTGWCQRLLWRLLEHGGRLDARVWSERALVPRDSREDYWGCEIPKGICVLADGIGLCKGDTVFHALVKAGRRDCGPECNIWGQEERVLSEGELWARLTPALRFPSVAVLEVPNSQRVSALDLMREKGRKLEGDPLALFFFR